VEEISTNGVRAAIAEMKSEKAAVLSGIATEMIKAGKARARVRCGWSKFMELAPILTRKRGII
jgi:hypothetical protein